MTSSINLLDHWTQDEPDSNDHLLHLVRLGSDQVAVIPFTSDVVLVRLHFCEEEEIGGYVHCNGGDCVLCQIGRKIEERALLPVYLPAVERLGVLPISPSVRPGALRPQLMPILRSNKRVVLLINKPDRAKYQVGSVELSTDMDDGAVLIKAFLEDLEAKGIDLASVYPHFQNEDLAQVRGIAKMLCLKRISRS